MKSFFLKVSEIIYAGHLASQLYWKGRGEGEITKREQIGRLYSVIFVRFSRGARYSSLIRNAVCGTPFKLMSNEIFDVVAFDEIFSDSRNFLLLV